MSDTAERRRLSPAEGRQIRINLGRVALLAIGLGIGMEALLAVGGQPIRDLSDLLDNSLWPYLVCLGVAIGQAVAAGRPLLAGPLALLFTPPAFVGAKVIQHGVAVLANNPTAGAAAITGDVLLEAGLRALEYAVLGAGLTWLAHQSWGGAQAHLSWGLAVGVVFGAVIGFLLPPGNWLSWIVEELVFPVGCALIIYASETLARLLPEA